MRSLDPAWRFSIVVFLVARIALSAWAYAVAMLIPLAASNLNLRGELVVTAFDLHSSARAVFSRVLDGKELHFRASPPNLVDTETNTAWDLAGRAVSSERAGENLSASKYTVEDVFPYRGVAPAHNIFLAPWQRFDANWYLKIAQRGYGDDGSSVYFPLYPFLIRAIGSLLLGNDLLAAILVSNLALVGVLYFLFQIALELGDRPSAKRAVAFFVLFPTAFSLFAPYTESLFLFFALLSLREGKRARWGRAGVWGALAALTRLQGVLMIVPLAYMVWKDFHNSWSQVAGHTSQAAGLTQHALRFTPLIFIPIGTLAFFAFTSLSLLTAYENQLHARFVLPWDNLVAALATIAQGRASLIDDLNLVATILFVVMAAPIWLRLPRELGLYSVSMFLAPLFRMTTEQPLVSMIRYVLAIFPAFVLWSRWSANAWVQRAIIYISFPLQLYLSAQFFVWGWVA